MKKRENSNEITRFKNHIEFIRDYFKGGRCVGYVNPDYIHEEGITRARAEELYNIERAKRKKYSKPLYRIKDTFTGMMRFILDSHYKTLLELMDIFQKDFIDEHDLDAILSDVETFYNAFYRNKDSEKEQSKPEL